MRPSPSTVSSKVAGWLFGVSAGAIRFAVGAMTRCRDLLRANRRLSQAPGFRIELVTLLAMAVAVNRALDAQSRLIHPSRSSREEAVLRVR